MKIESKKVWTSTTLLAAIGGFSGLLCGFSLISFVEWVEFFCLFPFFGAVSASICWPLRMSVVADSLHHTTLLLPFYQIIDACKKYGTADRNLWVQALSYFAGKEDDCKAQISEVLAHIDKRTHCPSYLKRDFVLSCRW